MKEVLESYGIATGDRWDWDLIQRPTGGRRFTGSADFHGWLFRLFPRAAVGPRTATRLAARSRPRARYAATSTPARRPDC
ncbi:hypothetical protein [Streptomyces sp. LN500]|uniref:hypothetical protein n=1 Tax=unclassified Streptomyces TaxID=2593676 RepID=UPI00371143AD